MPGKDCAKRAYGKTIGIIVISVICRMCGGIRGNMVQSIESMLKKHREHMRPAVAARPEFCGVDGNDVYNPTAPFWYEGKKILCARVEARDSEDSEAVFFEEVEKDIYVPADGLPRFVLQDPCITRVAGQYILGGTELFLHPENPKQIAWRTTFFCGDSLSGLRPLVKGPVGMKDVRLTELADKRIGIFTRPQGEKGGRGKIGFTVVDSLADVTPEVMEEAPLLELFLSEEWGGVNAVYLLEDGELGVLGHVACFAPEGIRHYYPMAFRINPVTGKYTMPVILAERSEFLAGESKREDLVDVLFSGGLCWEDEKLFLYVGVSDCEVQYKQIAPPF